MKKLTRCKRLQDPKPIWKDQCSVILGKIKTNGDCQKCPFNPSYIKDSKAKTIKPKFSVSSSKLFQAPKETVVEKLAITTEEAIEQLCRDALIPQENVRFYLHLYKKIDQAQTEMKNEAVPQIKMRKKIDRDQSRLLEKAFKFGWLGKTETIALVQLWQDSINKIENRIVTLDDMATGGYSMFYPEETKPGRRLNLAIEFLFYSLKKDAETFGGRPHYGEISDLLSSLKGEDKYDVLTLRGKKRDPHLNAFIINQTLSMCKAHFDAKGESFLPDSFPTNPEGRTRDILQTLGVILEDIRQHPRSTLSQLLGINAGKKKSSR